MSRYLYALVGEDSFLQIEALQQIVRSLGNVQRTDFDGETTGLAEVMDELRSFSMFAKTRLVVIRSADEFISRYRSEMEEYVQSPSDSATLVLRCRSLPGNQKISKLIAKHGTIAKCDPPSEKDLPDWIVRRAKNEHRLQIEPPAARLLADLIGTDLGRLDNELAKLALCVDGKIGLEEINRSVVFQREQEMWHMTDELTSGRTDKALERWRHLLQSDPSSEFRAVTWLGLWLEKAIKALQLRQQKVSPPAIAKQLRIWPMSHVDSLLRTVDRLGPQRLYRSLDLLTELDHRSKSGLGEAADNVERFILSIAKS
jgi:DNA polymerase-3 subunit delta